MGDCDVVAACSALRKEAGASFQRRISCCWYLISLSDILKLSSFDAVFSLIFGFLNSLLSSQALTESLGSAASIVQFADVISVNQDSKSC